MPTFSLTDPINIQDVRKAPKAPGLYVWYAQFRVGKADWHEEFAGSPASAQTNLLDALESHSMKFVQQGMPVQVTANFSTRWSGVLEENATSRWQDGFRPDVAEDSRSSLSSVCSKNDSRQALVDLLAASFPHFSSPLYVGLAVEQTLRERLKQHSSAFLSLWERPEGVREMAEEMGEPTNFAERALKSGFSPDDLFCYAMAVEPLPDEQLTNNDIGAVIMASEWVLNRWTIPILGRQ